MDFYVKEEWRVPAAVGAIAFLSGVGVGYFIALKRSETILVEETVIEVETEDDDAVERQRKLDFARAAGEAGHRGLLRERAATVYQGAVVQEVVEPDPEPEMEEDPADDGWDQEEENDNRSPDAPYVIHRQEFMDNEMELAQLDLEYFAGDNVLCDNSRVPIYNPAKVVGRLEFGRGSCDPNMVYIRNEKNSCEYAVTRVDGSYQMEVLGLEAEEAADEAEEAELKHSMPRFRMD